MRVTQGNLAISLALWFLWFLSHELDHAMRSEWMSFLETRPAPGDTAEPSRQMRDGPADANVLCPINDIGVLTVSGRDAEAFLQGQATCDMRKLGADLYGLGAICNPKGRVVTTFRTFRADGVFYLLTALDSLPAVQKRLQMYVLRADARLQDETEAWCCLGLIGGRATEFLSQQGMDPPSAVGRLSRQADAITLDVPASSKRYLILSELARAVQLWESASSPGDFVPATQSAWDREEIAQGLPLITAATSEEFVPQMLNLDLLGGISFEKGCYTGQEVVARMHYLGKPKRRMYRLLCRNGAAPQPGDLLYAAGEEDGQSVGRVVSAAPTIAGGYEMLAVIDIRQAETGDLRLHAKEGIAVERLPLPYTV
jgi:folate-binding protein YgfZ